MDLFFVLLHRIFGCNRSNGTWCIFEFFHVFLTGHAEISSNRRDNEDNNKDEEQHFLPVHYSSILKYTVICSFSATESSVIFPPIRLIWSRVRISGLCPISEIKFF